MKAAFPGTPFDVFVTIDRKLERQHNVKTLKLGFVVARVPSNEIGSYRPILAELLRAVENVKRGEAIHVVNPRMRAWRGGHGIKSARRA